MRHGCMTLAAEPTTACSECSLRICSWALVSLICDANARTIAMALTRFW